MAKSRKLWLVLWLALCLIILGACSKKEEGYLEIDDDVILENEIMLYLLQTYNEFEELGGSEVWEINDFSGGKSASDVAKQGALDNLIMTKVLVKKAAEMNLELNENQSSELELQANEYFDNLATSFVEKYDITLEVVRRVLLENNLAMLVEENTKSNYEVTRDELGAKLLENEEYNWVKDKIAGGTEAVLTSYTIEHIVTYTHTKNQEGEWVPKGNGEGEVAKVTIEEALDVIEEGMLFFQRQPPYILKMKICLNQIVSPMFQYFN